MNIQRLTAHLRACNVGIVDDPQHGHLVNMDDFVDKIIKSKSREQYIVKNMRDYVTRGTCKYIKMDICAKLIERSTKPDLKQLTKVLVDSKVNILPCPTIQNDIKVRTILVNNDTSPVIADTIPQKNNVIANTISIENENVQTDAPLQTNTNTIISITNFYEYENKKILVLKDKLGNPLFKAKTCGEILDYKDTDKAIRNHVDDDDKISLEEIEQYNRQLFFSGLENRPAISAGLEKSDKKAIFINESGLYSLILFSKKPEAKAFKKWITSIVLPSIRQHGSYSIQSTPQPISFYAENGIDCYDGKNVLYIGYIGNHGNEVLYKYGKTSSIYTRDYKQHKKTFSTFNIIHIAECDNKDVVETKFKRELDVRQILRAKTFANKQQTELFTTTIVHTIESIKQLMNDLIKNNPMKAITNLENKLIEAEKNRDLKIEEEKTKQEQEKTKQLHEQRLIEREKTKRLMARLKQCNDISDDDDISDDISVDDGYDVKTKNKRKIDDYDDFPNIYKQYLDERTEHCNQHIHTSTLYDDFKSWFVVNNPRSHNIPSNRDFAKEIKKYHTIENVRVKSKLTTGIKNLQLVNLVYE